MKKLILSLAFAGTMIMAISACNSSKNMAGSSDSTGMDTMSAPVDTTVKPVDTMNTTPPDTTKKM